jgi:hypothetical protein
VPTRQPELIAVLRAKVLSVIAAVFEFSGFDFHFEV